MFDYWQTLSSRAAHAAAQSPVVATVRAASFARRRPPAYAGSTPRSGRQTLSAPAVPTRRCGCLRHRRGARRTASHGGTVGRPCSTGSTVEPTGHPRATAFARTVAGTASTVHLHCTARPVRRRARRVRRTRPAPYACKRQRCSPAAAAPPPVQTPTRGPSGPHRLSFPLVVHTFDEWPLQKERDDQCTHTARATSRPCSHAISSHATVIWPHSTERMS